MSNNVRHEVCQPYIKGGGIRGSGHCFLIIGSYIDAVIFFKVLCEVFAIILFDAHFADQP